MDGKMIYTRVIPMPAGIRGRDKGMKQTRTEQELKDCEVTLLQELFTNCMELAACYKAAGKTEQDTDVAGLVGRANGYRRQLKALGVLVG